MSIKNGIVLNRMYTGSYLSTNLGHEVINMFQADNGNHYLYLNSKGNFTERGKEVGTMLLVRGIGKGRVEVVGMAKNLRPVESACCTLPRDLGKIKESVRKEQKTFLTEGEHIVTYGKVPILNIFGEKGQQSVYVSYWVEGEDFHTPKSGTRLILEFPPSKKKDKNEKEQVDDDYQAKEKVEKVVFYDSENNEKAIITIRLKTHNFASTSLHQFILEEDEEDDFSSLTEICNNEVLWEVKNNKIEFNDCVDFEKHEISLFDICQIQNDENRFSNALSYFIQKYPELWREFLQQHSGIKNLGKIESVTREEDAKVNKEGWNNKTGGRIDLLIRTKNHYVIIENKIGSDIIIKDNVSQLDRYYNYVQYLKKEELDRLGKEIKDILEEIKKQNKICKAEIEKLIQISTNIKEEKKKETIGLVLAPNYNMPNKDERKVKNENKVLYTYEELPYSKIWKELKIKLEKDPNFEALNNAIEVLDTDYTKSSEEERQVNDDFTYQELPYKKVYEWLSKNASKELGEDANFKAFHNAMKKHTYEYENEALYDDMKDKFFSRINEFKNKNNA